VVVILVWYATIPYLLCLACIKNKPLTKLTTNNKFKKSTKFYYSYRNKYITMKLATAALSVFLGRVTLSAARNPREYALWSDASNKNLKQHQEQQHPGMRRVTPHFKKNYSDQEQSSFGSSFEEDPTRLTNQNVVEVDVDDDTKTFKKCDPDTVGPDVGILTCEDGYSCQPFMDDDDGSYGYACLPDTTTAADQRELRKRTAGPKKTKAPKEPDNCIGDGACDGIDNTRIGSKR
jgi:hypothetical protein